MPASPRLAIQFKTVILVIHPPKSARLLRHKAPRQSLSLCDYCGNYRPITLLLGGFPAPSRPIFGWRNGEPLAEYFSQSIAAPGTASARDLVDWKVGRREQHAARIQPRAQQYSDGVSPIWALKQRRKFRSLMVATFAASA